MRVRELEGVSERRDTFFYVDPRVIQIDPGYNVRDFSNPAIVEANACLRESVRNDGVRVPVVVRKKGDSLVLVQGHRRLSVTMDLIREGVEIKTIPALVEPSHVDDFDRAVDLIRSNSGHPLTPLEQATAIKRLIDFGWSDDEIAKRLGWSVATVANRKMLLSAPEEVRNMIASGEVSASRAVETIRREGAEDAAETLRTEGPSKRGRPKGSKNREKGKTRERTPEPSSPGALTVTQINKLVSALKKIAVEDPTGTMAAIANKALGACNLLDKPTEEPSLLSLGSVEGNERDTPLLRHVRKVHTLEPEGNHL